LENILEIYPTSRAIRIKKEEFLKHNSFIPKMLTVADFESRVIVTPYKMVDNLHRTLFLKQASAKEKFNRFFLDRSLVKFYTQSSDFFKFFEELALEKVSIKELYIADSYAEFSKDLELLEELLEEYEKILKQNGYSDRAFLPKEYEINWDFINNFDGFTLELEGFLTQFELELFSKISQKKPFYIKLRTTPFNKKIQKKFLELNIELKEDGFYKFELSSKKIVKNSQEKFSLDNIEVVKCSERLEQIALAIAKIEEFVNQGIEPQKIALVTPSEDIALSIDLLDRYNNFNFAMGKSFAKERETIFLEEINRFLKGDELAKEFLKNHNFDFNLLPKETLEKKIDIDSFFEILKSLNIPLYSSENFLKDLEELNLLRKFYNFKRVFARYKFNFKEWLFFWLDIVKKHTLDDVGGGKITVLGVLETRAIEFDAVVIIDFNEGVVPSSVSKDRFLNTKVRALANLPTISDRENLQKHYYARVLERAKRSFITYVENDDLAPSKFIYELNLLKNLEHYKAPIEIFYPQESNFFAKAHLEDKEVAFDAKSMLWSNSKLKTFLDCKRKFFYRYIAGIKEPITQDESDGVILHAILAKVLTPQNRFDSFEELKKAFLVELNNYNKKADFPFKSRLWSKLIDEFLKLHINHTQDGWQIDSVEHSCKGVINGLEFSGRVDRIDKKRDFYLVIDYKSSSTDNFNKKKVDDLSDFQMSIYKKLLALNDAKVDFAYVNVLDDKGFSYLEASQEKEEKLLEHIDYLKSQKSFKASRCENLQMCRNCAYRLFCHRGEYL